MARLLWLIVALVAGLHWYGTRGPAPGDPRTSAARGDILLLSAEWCGYCHALRRDLEAMGVPFRELDIEDRGAGRAAYDALDGRAIPILVVGQDVIRGYNPDLARELIVAAGHRLAVR